MCAFFFFQACGRKLPPILIQISHYSKSLSSVFTGIVSSESDIRVVWLLIKKWKVNEVLDNDLFTISPSVDGK
jgi:hypothetical protein